MRMLPLIATVLLFGGPVLAQPEDAPPRPPMSQERTPDDPQEAQRYLERRIEELEKRRERMREALRKIREGVPVREAMRDLDPRGDGPPGFDRRPDRHEARPFSDRERERPRQPVTPEQRAHALAFLREHLPRVADRLDALEKSSPEAVDGGYARLVPRVLDAESLIHRDPELFKLKLAEIEGTIDVAEAIRAFREADAAEDPTRITETRAKLREALSRQMDIRIELQMREINALTRQLEDLKADVEKRRTNRDASLDATIERIRTFRPRQEREQGEKSPR
jgi:hypothetical protein